MKDSEIYRRAAERIDMGHTTHSCVAVCAVSSALCFGRLRKEYSDVFASIEIDGTYFLDPQDVEKAGGKTWRVLALCLMSAIAKSEGR